MNSLKTSKILGVAGSIFIFLGLIPYFSDIFNLIGGILFFAAIYKIGNILRNKSIFQKFLTGFIIEISGIFFGAAVVLIFFPNFFEYKSYISVIIGFLIIYPFIVIGSNFYKKSFVLIALRTNNKFFKLAGSFMFWGAVGIIFFGLGLVLIYAGWFVIIKAFLSLPNTILKDEDDYAGNNAAVNL